MKFSSKFAVASLFSAIVQAHSVQAVELPILPGHDDVGQVQVISARYEDTFADLGETNGLGFTEMVLANPGKDAWLPGTGTKVVLPTHFLLPPGPREGIVINLAEFRLYYYSPKGDKVDTYAIGIGTDESPSPLTETRVRAKVPNPAWYPPESIRAEHAKEGDILPKVVPAGPDNPLGPFKLQLDLPNYLIHGSNKRFGIGTRVSHGCIRLYNKDILQLGAMVKPGTPVRFISDPIKLGLSGDDLMIELNVTTTEITDEIRRDLRIQAIHMLADFEKERGAMLIDGRKLEAAIENITGLPVVIGQRARMSASAPLPMNP